MIARILTSAFAVFVLDGLYVIVELCFIRRRATVEEMFQGIASSILGPAAATGGWQTAAVGVLLHFGVSLGWSAAWIILYENSASLRRLVAAPSRAILVGAGYGIFVWAAMRFGVLQLTLAKPGTVWTFGALLIFLAHVFVVGPPIVLLGRRRHV